MALAVKKKYPVPHKVKAHHTLPQRTYKREQRKLSARRTARTLLALVVIAAGAGIAYTWYQGQHPSASANQPAPVRTSRAVITPSKVASDAKVGVALQTSTPEIKPGENAAVSVRTNPEAECSIVAKYNNVPATDSGLAPKQTDEFGVTSWSWTVPAGTPAGAWPAEVTCKNKKHSAVLRIDMTIK